MAENENELKSNDISFLNAQAQKTPSNTSV